MASFSRFKSHPDIYLIDHLKGVAEEAKSLLLHPALNFSEVLSELAYLTGLAHDFGKFTSFFQRHLAGEKVNRDLSQHSVISALFGAWLVSKQIDLFRDFSLKQFLPLLAYIVIRVHHGNLMWPEDLMLDKNDRFWYVIENQLKDLTKNRGSIEREWERLNLDISEFFDVDLGDVSEKLNRLWFIAKYSKEEDKTKLALWTQLLFSALIDADKFHAGKTKRPSRIPLPGDLVDKYVKVRFEKKQGKLNEFREKIYREVVSKAKKVPLPGLFSLTAPTGSGKTLTALSFALKIREKLYNKWGIPPRIIYVLPLINLIEQNYRVFREVFSLFPNFHREPEKILLQHHYLAEIQYRVQEDRIPVSKALLLTESWESEIVVSTFVQIFHTLFGFKNRFMKKFHSFIGSIIIFDEPQSFPMEFWGSIGNVMELLNKEIGATGILMTATKPMIFRRSIELVGDKKVVNDFSIHVRRTKIKKSFEIRNEEKLISEIGREIEKKSILVVLNTIRQSLNIYNFVKNVYRKKLTPYSFSFKFHGEIPLVYLSTNIVPYQRKERLRFLKKWLKKRKPVVVISTQVIEAGVDLDFQRVIREIAPLDSIIQAAGRCNREGKRKEEEVLVIELDRKAASRLYGAVHMKVAREILEQFETVIPEACYNEILFKYFNEATKLIGEDDNLWKFYKDLKFASRALSQSLEDFSLISQRPEIPIFVSLTKKREKWLLEIFLKEVLKEKDKEKRREAYLSYKKTLHDFSLQISVERASKNLPPSLVENSESAMRWIPYDDLKKFYDLETGFKWLKDEEPWVI